MFKRLIIIFFLFFSIKAYGASFTFPTTLTADTTGFVLVSNSGHQNTFNISANLSF